MMWLFYAGLGRIVAKVFKGTGTKIAIMAGNSSVMDKFAEEIRARAHAFASERYDTGEYSHNFTVHEVPAKSDPRVKDRMVVNDHPAALAIEYGHFAGAELNPVWVAGQFNLTRAVRS